MAFLLLLHQKMSLQRKVNKLTLAQTSIGTRKERISKRIEKVQKAYAKKQSRLDAKAKLMTSQANNWVSQQMMASNYQMVNWQDYAMQNAEFKAAYEKAYAQNATTDDQKKFQEWISANKTLVDGWQNQATSQNNQAAAARQQQQYWANTFTTNMNDQISIWLEAEKQKLEDQEQLALAPLEDEDTQIDLEQASNEAQLSYAQSRLDAIKQALDSRAQEAPKFGA